MASEFGQTLRVSVFGQSHGDAVGVLMEGLPAGEAISLTELQTFLNRRRPKADGLSTARRETDVPVFLSGLTFPSTDTKPEHGRKPEHTGEPAYNGEPIYSREPAHTGEPIHSREPAHTEEPERTAVTNGFPLCAVLENADPRSGDYAALQTMPRPGHADFTAWAKWGGFADMRGGGHFSGRLTAPLCVAGGIAKQILSRRGLVIGAHLQRVGGVPDAFFPPDPTPDLLADTAAKPFPVLDDEAGERMKAVIAKARREGDSVGGVVECAAVGVPSGLGGPLFGGLESRMAAAVFGIPAVKGIEFGTGFQGADLRGSENNDPFSLRDGTIITETNHSGGILGGISTGMPILFRAAFKPTPSIGKPQNTVNLSTRKASVLTIAGRHDPCVAHRAVPVVEAAAACVLLDALMEFRGVFWRVPKTVNTV